MTELRDPFSEPLANKRNTVIWRYVSLERFLAFVSTRELYLARLDTFEDPWEASWPKSVIDQWAKGARSMSPKLDLVLNYTGKLAKMFFASCWFASDHESAALWKLFARENGLAIRTTVGNLINSISADTGLIFGFVKYLDYRQDNQFSTVGTTQPPFLKRMSFEYEREFRVAKLDVRAAPEQRGLSVACDWEKLAPSLYLSPEADDYMVSIVERLLEQFDASGITVEKSDLYGPRLY